MTNDQHEQDVLVFCVTVRSTDPPPNWPQDALTKLRREMELMYGKNVDVEIQSHLRSSQHKFLVDLANSFDDGEVPSRNGDSA